MARITRSQLDRYAARAAEALGLAADQLWLQHSETGYVVQRRFGAGAQALGECLTGREAQQLLRGLEIGAQLKP
jgi:phytoene/squalene synthetase